MRNIPVNADRILDSTQRHKLKKTEPLSVGHSAIHSDRVDSVCELVRRRQLVIVATICFLTSLIGTGCQQDFDGTTAETNTQLQGSWRLIESNSQHAPSQIQIWGDKMYWVHANDHPVTPLILTYRVNPDSETFALDVIHDDSASDPSETFCCVAKVDGDHLTLASNLNASSRPASIADADEVARYERIEHAQPEVIEFLHLHDTGYRLNDRGELSVVNFAQTEISDDDLEHLAGLESLRKVFLFDTAISNDGLRHLSELMLEELVLVNTNVDDAVVPLLSSMASLRRLNVGFTSISSEGVASLRQALPECQIEARQE